MKINIQNLEILPSRIGGIPKKVLIDEIKQYYGIGCIDEETYNFPKQNIVIFKYNNFEVILYFHYSKEIGFFGCDIGYIDMIIEYIIKNPAKKIYSFIYLILGDLEMKKVNFAIPVFFVKKIHDKEKEKFLNKIEAKKELLKKYAKYELK